MKIGRLIFLACLSSAVSLRAQDAAMAAGIDEAFQLADVRAVLDSLPSRVNQITAAALARFPKDQRRQFEPLIQDVSLQFLATDLFYRQLRTYFVTHYDGRKMAAFLALERTTAYRSMHRLEAAAETPAGQAGRPGFEADLKSDPPSSRRIDILRHLDEALKTTDLEVRIAAGIVNAMSAGLGAPVPAGASTASLQPVLANNVLLRNLYVYRNAEDADLEDYVAAAQQPSVEWFNQNLRSAILAVAAERTALAGKAIKTKVSKPFN